MLDFAQRYTAQLDCGSLETAERILTATNAFLDAADADGRVIRLVLPGGAG